MADPAPQPTRGLFAILGVFALGVVFGVALSFMIVHHFGRLLPARAHRDAAGLHERILRQLDLDATQEPKVRQLLDQAHAKVREILDETRRQIRAELRPDQQEKLDRIHPTEPRR